MTIENEPFIDTPTEEELNVETVTIHVDDSECKKIIPHCCAQYFDECKI